MNTDDLKEFYSTQNGEKILFTCVIISSPTLGSINLAKEQFGELTFLVDGVPTTFQGAMVEVPEQAILASDDTDKGSLQFNRIGYEVVSKLRQLDDASEFEAVTVRVLQYLEGSDVAQSDYSAFAYDFKIGSRDVEIRLTTRNLEKTSRANEIFDPAEFPALKTL